MTLLGEEEAERRHGSPFLSGNDLFIDGSKIESSRKCITYDKVTRLNSNLSVKRRGAPGIARYHSEGEGD